MNNMLQYKGYHAKIEFSADDDAFVGEVFGINDTLVFDGGSVAEIERMFHQTIDDYLETCKEFGKAPEKEFKGSFNVRIPQQLHRQAALEAARRGVSLNQLVNSAIEREVSAANPA